ncbi:unnamed protein product [Periconia digitata]|uniref:Uncharacterized protein n=1 Tax=Periconia digitata TaxID=1303443 RepID=A0A9W4U2N9_9PLEO|nr:unnamed protein product [Periconia digitata]
MHSDVYFKSLQRSAQRLRLCKLESREVDKDLEILERNRKDLIEKKERIDNEFEILLRQHAKAECRQLASMMLQRLPLEIREMVYEYVYVEESPITIGSHHFTPSKPTRVSQDREELIQDGEEVGRGAQDLVRALLASAGEGAMVQDHSSSPPDGIIMPTDHALDPTFMGKEVAHEVSKFYYASNTFSMCTIDDSIERFLLYDVATNFPDFFNEEKILDLVPIDHVRNLQIRVKNQHLSFRGTAEFDMEKDMLMDIFRTFDALTHSGRTETSPQMSLEVILMTSFPPRSLDRSTPDDETRETRRRLTNILEAIRSPLYKLQHDQNTQISVLHHDESSFAFPRPLTHLFALDKSNWELEKEELKKAMTVYSPLDFVVKTGFRTAEGQTGDSVNELKNVLERRWACNPDMRLNPEFSISKSAYWPVRTPSDLISEPRP